MSFVISGLDPEPFRSLFGRSDAELAERGVLRRTVDAWPGYPCRITLEDAPKGETVLLLNHVSHAADTPFRSAYAIYVREGAGAARSFVDRLPPVMERRPIALRCFDGAGLLVGADLFAGEDGAAKIRAAFDRDDVAYIHAHNAMPGCFAAEIRRA